MPGGRFHREVYLPAPRGQRPGMLLNTLLCPGRLHHKGCQSEPTLRNWESDRNHNRIKQQLRIGTRGDTPAPITPCSPHNWAGVMMAFKLRTQKRQGW